MRNLVQRLGACLLVLSAPLLVAQPQQSVPSIDDLMNLKTIGGSRISPDGRWVAYTVTETDWTQNAYVSQLWLAETTTGKRFQLTRGLKSSNSPQWSPDGVWLAFTGSRVGDKSQVFLISPSGGEAVQATAAEQGVNTYAWSKDGRSLAYTSTDTDAKGVQARKDHLGDFEVVRREYERAQLWTLDLSEALKAPAAGKQRTKGKTLHVVDFDWSPEGGRIAFTGKSSPDLIHEHTSDIFVLDLKDDSVKKVVDQPGPDGDPTWSPDGKWIAFSSYMGNPAFFHANNRIALVPADGGKPVSLTDAFDEESSIVAWTPEGLYFSALQKTASHLFRLDPSTKKISRVSKPDPLLVGDVSFTKDGTQMAFTAPSSNSMNEVYVSQTATFAPRKLTDMTAQVKAFTLGSREVIHWKSQDGTTIEGVLIKPAGFDPTKKYALLCVIHGGPTGVDRPTMLDTRYYPTDLWAAKGALILKVNYRGSAGYGEAFRQLNVRNLGVGDAWDVISGVDHLVAKGWVDPARVGCMGWSQGGYISAFLTTASDRFKAFSVGAGISNWSTYYYNTDITPFTPQYLGADPASDPAIYAKTSPMTRIKEAKTPTLIQHGELDHRVPIANAYELRQGLEDRGVPVEMVVYKGFGHGINKPRSMRAVMQHNLDWFNHYIWGDPKPDFSAPQLPKKVEDKKVEDKPKKD